VTPHTFPGPTSAAAVSWRKILSPEKMKYIYVYTILLKIDIEASNPSPSISLNKV